jgi:hypothetical protein
MSGTFRNLSTPPSEAKYKQHYFCDYIELLVLASGDSLSKSDVAMRFGKEDGAEKEDEEDSYILELFQILEVRQNTFKEFYPFEVKNGVVSSIKLKDNLELYHNSYLFLLLTSSLQYINQQHIFGKDKILENEFETFSYRIFKRYLGNCTQVYQFGASNEAGYRGTLQEKVDNLAKNLKYQTKYKSHYFDKRNSGDGGLDIVAWKYFPNDINMTNIEIYLGQCATGENWLKKLDDVDKFKNYIDFEGVFTKYMFIPYDARNMDRTFTEEKDIHRDLVMFDRSRFFFSRSFVKYRLFQDLKGFSLLENIQKHKGLPNHFEKDTPIFEDIV